MAGIKMNRRRILKSSLGIAVALSLPALASAKPAKVEVWKSPDCGCCKTWLKHLEAQGIGVVTIHDIGNAGARQALGIPVKLGSCHTAKIEGYAIEGHVPAREIKRLLKEKPTAIGLAVPGMPLGSPGMDGPDFDNQTQPYDVLLVLKDGSTRVYQSYFR